MFPYRVAFLLVCVVFFSFLFSISSVYAVEYEKNNKTSLSGNDKNSGISFESSEQGNGNVYSFILLPSNKKITCLSNYKNKDVSIKVISSVNGELVPLTKDDVLNIRKFATSFHENGINNENLGNALASLVSFMMQAPTDEPISIGG